MDYNKDEEVGKKYFDLGSISSLVSFSLLVSVFYTVLRYHLLYQVLLHIPIFQYIEASELILLFASSATIWVIYLGGINLVTFISGSAEFTASKKIVFSLVLYMFLIFYAVLNYRNDPSFRMVIMWPFILRNWLIYLLIILSAVLIFIAIFKKAAFFKTNPYIMPLAASLWYATFDGWANYEVITNGRNVNNIMVKTKTENIITNDTLVNAGRTKNFWFFYNRKTRTTRVIKADDIDYTDFSADNK